MSDEKTEQPTAKRLREAREKGEVAKSQEVPSALTVMLIAVWFIAMGSSMLMDLIGMTEVPFLVMNRPFTEALTIVSETTLFSALKVAGPLFAMVMLIALCANLAQVGVLFSFEAIIPKIENLNPKKWFQKVFSLKNAVEFLKNIIKITVLGLTSWYIFMKHLPTLFRIPSGTVEHIWTILGTVILDLILTCASVFCVIAAVDWLFQRWQFTKQHMMSKDEVKREYKESEGDPMIKGKRKQLHQELLAQGKMDKVRKSKVLITNPTHYAIALDYDQEKTPLPIVLAKGEGELAKRMIKVAEEEGIPIMRNVPLAHALFEQGTEDAYIPSELIVPVAEVLRWVQSLSKT